jgi:hypothetical protein
MTAAVGGATILVVLVALGLAYRALTRGYLMLLALAAVFTAIATLATAVAQSGR